MNFSQRFERETVVRITCTSGSLAFTLQWPEEPEREDWTAAEGSVEEGATLRLIVEPNFLLQVYANLPGATGSMTSE